MKDTTGGFLPDLISNGSYLSMSTRHQRASSLVNRLLEAEPPANNFALRLKDIAKALDVRYGIRASVEYPGKLVIDLPDDSSLWFGDENGPLGYSHVHSDGQALLGAEDDGPQADDPMDELIKYVVSVVNHTLDRTPR